MQFSLTFEPEFDALYTEFAEDSNGIRYLDYEGISPDKIDVSKMGHSYFTENLAYISLDMNANANEELSPNNHQSEVTKGILKLQGYYLLWKYMKKRFGLERANQALESIWDGSLYFHDAGGHGIQVPYCFAFSTSHIMHEGRPYGQLHSLPPRRADSFMAQVIEVCMDMSQEFAGAVAPSDLIVNYCYYSKLELLTLTNLAREFILMADKVDGEHMRRMIINQVVKMVAHFYHVDLNDEKEHHRYYKQVNEVGFSNINELVERLHFKKVLNDFQKFVHVSNNKFRTSGQSPFINISLFDRPNLEKIFGSTTYPDGSKVDFDYVMKVQEVVGDWFSKGDPKSGLPYRFPVMTVNISTDEGKDIIDEQFLDFVARTNVDKGVYNIYGNDGNKISMCCRFINDMERMQYRADSFGNGGLNIGSTRITTINTAKVAMEAEENREKFFDILRARLDLAKDLLIVHREEILQRRIDGGFLKFFKPLEWLNLGMFFSTFGITGIYETCYYMGLPIESPEGTQFARDVLKFIDDYAIQASHETKYSFNTEEIPGESAVVTLANKDKVTFGDRQIFKLYSNQYIPLIADVGVIDRIKISSELMNELSGGGILHINIADKIDDLAKMRKLIQLVLKAGVPHFAVNYGFGICEKRHTTIVGNKRVCPICGSPIDDYMSRVIGYFTKVSSWNKVRREYDYPKRKFN